MTRSMCKDPKLLLPGGFSNWPARDQRLYTMRARWLSKARPEQLPPEGDWRTWLLLSGRGFGKTRLAAEDVGYYGMKHRATARVGERDLVMMAADPLEIVFGARATAARATDCTYRLSDSRLR
jgi:phage terminase large subunit-like protein